MQISARNILKGTVKEVIPGAVNTEVILTLDGGAEIVSIITKDSAENLRLTPGKTAYAVVKSSDVMVAVDCSMRNFDSIGNGIIQARWHR